jgi:hypothetical protein
MPAYPQPAGSATLLYHTKQGLFWLGETVSTTYPGSLSVAFQLQRVDSAFYPWGFAVEVQFAGNPGVFEVDVMGAETDNPANYIKIGSIAAVSSLVSGQYTGRFESVSLYPKYVALNMLTLTNAVPVTAKISL